MAHNIEATISNLVKNQFPEFYQTEGPVFVAFVQKYYEWLETTGYVANQSYADAKQNCLIDVKAGNTQIISSTNNATFDQCFEVGDQIAIYTTNTNYELYTVGSIPNTSTVVLTEAPNFSVSNTRYSTLQLQKNPVKYLREFYDDIDVDTTAEEFLVYFKEKYLKGIQFDTNVDQRRVIKHALDIYRSKGTPRSVDLLFKLAFGVGARLYYPGDDLLRASDGQWVKPTYLEVSLREENARLVNRQIFGYTSGATAFVEAVVRRNVKNRLVDILYISAINGNFQTGELINSSGLILAKTERPTIIGSMTTITVEGGNPGSGFTVGDIVDIESVTGDGGKARIAETADATGIVNISLEDGGYGYTANAEILISNTVVRIANLQVASNSMEFEYFKLFEKLVQPLATIDYVSATGTINVGDEVFTYWPNNAVKGYGRVLSGGGSEPTSSISVATVTGDLSVLTDDLYFNANTVQANSILYTNTTVQGNVIAWGNNVNVYTQSKVGDYVPGEFVYQVDGGNNVTARAEVISYDLDFGANGVLELDNVWGVIRSNIPIQGELSSATSNVVNQLLEVGVTDNFTGAYLALDGNYITSERGHINGYASFVSSGGGLGFNLGTFNFTETITINEDIIIDYENLPLTQVGLTGTAQIYSTQVDVDGTGTAFTTEANTDVTGSCTVTTINKAIFGSGTTFDTEVTAGEIVVINNQYMRIREVVNSSLMLTNAYATANVTSTAVKAPWLRFSNATYGEAGQIDSIVDNTNLNLTVNSAVSDTGLGIEFGWGFPGNTAANLTYGVLDDIFSGNTMTVGRINNITFINRGTGYNLDPFVRIYEPYITAAQEFTYDEITFTGPTASFSPGETITQDTTGGRALVVQANSSYILGRRLRVLDANNFVNTTSVPSQIAGDQSGARANVVGISSYSNSEYLGINAVLDSPAAFSNGAIVSLEVIDSGFGFYEGDDVFIVANNNVARGVVSLGKQGTGSGFYRRTGGFPSGTKHIHDGFYWQDYSYEIRSSVQLSTYEDMLKQIVHVAGTQYFGAFIFDTLANNVITHSETVITTSLQPPMNVEAATELGGTLAATPLYPNNIESGSNVASVDLILYSNFFVDGIESATEVEAETVQDITDFLADNIQSTSQAGTATYVVRSLTAQSISADVNNGLPLIQSADNAMGADSIQSVTEAQAAENPNLTASPLNVVTEAEQPQNTNFGAQNEGNESTSEVGSPTLAEI